MSNELRDKLTDLDPEHLDVQNHHILGLNEKEADKHWSRVPTLVPFIPVQSSRTTRERQV